MRRSAAAILLALTTLAGARAQTYTWVGTGTTAWETPGNWSPSGPPNSGVSVLLATTASETITLGTTASGSTTNDSADNLTLTAGASFVLTGATVAGTNTTATDNLTVSGNMTKTGSTSTIRNSKSANNGVGEVNLDILGTFTGGSISFGSTSIALSSLTVGGLFTDNTVLAVSFNTTSANLNGGLTMTGASTVNVFASSGTGGITTAYLSGTIGTVDAYTTAGSTGTLTINGTSGSNSYGSATSSTAGILADGVAGSTLNLVKTGAGTQILTGNNTYSGGTTINGGALYANNNATVGGSALGTGAVTVGSSGTLGGTGTISLGSNAVTVNGILSPGSAGAGKLTLGSGTTLAFGSGSSLAVTLGTTSTSLVFAGTAANSVSGLSNLTLNITTGAGFAIGTIYTILGTATTATSGTSYTVDAVDLNGSELASNQYVLVVDSSNDYTFEEEAVPEPATWAMLLGSAALGCALWRRRAAGRSQERPDALPLG